MGGKSVVVDHPKPLPQYCSTHAPDVRHKALSSTQSISPRTLNWSGISMSVRTANTASICCGLVWYLCEGGGGVDMHVEG